MDDSLTGMILTYSDEKMDEAFEETGFKAYVKDFWSGVVQGFVDFMFGFGLVSWILIVVGGFLAKKKGV